MKQIANLWSSSIAFDSSSERIAHFNHSA